MENFSEERNDLSLASATKYNVGGGGGRFNELNVYTATRFAARWQEDPLNIIMK